MSPPRGCAACAELSFVLLSVPAPAPSSLRMLTLQLSSLRNHFPPLCPAAAQGRSSAVWGAGRSQLDASPDALSSRRAAQTAWSLKSSATGLVLLQRLQLSELTPRKPARLYLLRGIILLRLVPPSAPPTPLPLPLHQTLVSSEPGFRPGLLTVCSTFLSFIQSALCATADNYSIVLTRVM